MFSYQVNLSDPNNAGGAVDPILVYDLQQALAEWSKYITGQGTLVVQLNVLPTATGRESGGPTSTFFVGTNGARNVFESSAEYELATGLHVSGTTSDITVTIDPGYFNQISLQSGLTATSSVEANKLNPINVFMHEIGHGLGISSFYSTSGVLPATFEGKFDTFIQLSSGHPYFVGPTAEAIYGGPVPITDDDTTQNYSHFGTTISDQNVSAPSKVTDPLTLDLMNGIVFFYNYDYQISDLDLAVLRDLGLNAGRPLVGTAGNDTLHLSAINNSVSAGAGNDVIYFDAAGSRTVDGGVGLDTVVFPGQKSLFSVSTSGSTTTVANAGLGTQTLINVERLQFSDLDLALDVQGDAGSAYRLYQAAFNRTPDTAGLSFWTHQLDLGIDILTVAQDFTASSEFMNLYGGSNPSATTLINLLYSNVLGRSPDQAGFDFWASQLAGGTSVGAILEGFAVSAENHALVDPRIAQGIVLDHTAFLV